MGRMIESYWLSGVLRSRISEFVAEETRERSAPVHSSERVDSRELVDEPVEVPPKLDRRMPGVEREPAPSYQLPAPSRKRNRNKRTSSTKGTRSWS